MNQKKHKIIFDQIIELAKAMPMEKLDAWYKYGLFIQYDLSNMLIDTTLNEMAQLEHEFNEWEAASEEDSFQFEQMLEVMKDGSR